MSRTVLNRTLVGVIVALALVATFLRRDFALPNYVFTPEMVFSIPYDSFAPNPIFKDGKTMQLPVAGTVSRNASLFQYEATEADAIRAGEELHNPWNESGIDADQLLAAQARGRKIYARFCLPCHGAVGNGDGPAAKNGFPPPPSLSLEKSLKMSEGQMFHVLTFGQKNMPGYASQIAPDDRWKAILHVKSIQDAAVRKIEAEKLALASVEAGRQIFERLNCNKCHTVSPGQKPVGPFLGKVAQTYTRDQLHEAILHPSKTIAEGFLAQVFLMLDGRTHSGFVTGESDTQVTIRNSDGNEVKIDVDEIDERKTLERSPMPDGLVKDLSDDDLQFLLDYLKSLTSESAPVEQPAGTDGGEPGQGEVPLKDQSKADNENDPNTLREEK